MASATEIERLVVRLMGDTSDYTDKLEKVVNDSIGAYNKIQNAVKGIESNSKMQQEAARITKSLMTDTEKYAQTLDNLQRHLHAETISQETFNRGVDKARQLLPSYKAALEEAARAKAEFNRQEKESSQIRSKLEKEGAAVTNSLLTQTERYAASLDNLQRLLHQEAISQETFNRGVKNLEQLLPSYTAKLNTAISEQKAFAESSKNLAAQQAELNAQARRVTESVETQREKFNKIMTDNKMLYQEGRISIETYLRVLEKERQKLPEIIAAREAAKRVLKEEAAVLKEAAKAKAASEAAATKLTKSVETEAEAFRRNVASYKQLYKEREISLTTYLRALEKERQTLPQVVAAQQQAAAAQRALDQARKDAQAIVERNMTLDERVMRSMGEANRLYTQGALTVQTYTREMARLNKVLADDTMRQQAERMSRYASFVNQYGTAKQRLRLVAEGLRKELRAGIITIGQYRSALQQARQTILQTDDSIAKLGQQLFGLGFNMTLIGGAITAGLSAVLFKSLQAAGGFQQARIALKTMLGDAKEAEQTFKDIAKFAMSTPFTFDEVLKASMTMITFGERGEQLNQTLVHLGNAAAATNTEFSLVALVFNQIRGVGHLLQQDFRQLSTRGVISLNDLAKHFNVSTQEAQKMMTTSRISFEEVRAIMKGLSEEGGRFHKLMEEQAKTITGRWNILIGVFELLQAELGEQLVPIAQAVVAILIEMGEWLIDAPTWIKKVIAYTMALVAALGALALAIGTVTLAAGQLTMAWGAIMKIGAVAWIANIVKGLWALVTVAVAVKAALMALAFAAGVLLGYNLAAWWNAEQVKEFEDSINSLRNSFNKYAEELSAHQDKIIKKIRETQNLADRGLMIETNLEETFNEIHKLEEQVARAKNAAAASAPGFFMSFFGESQGHIGDKAILEGLEAELRLRKEHIKVLQEEQSALPRTSEELIAAYSEMSKELEFYNKHLGRTHKELQVLKLVEDGLDAARANRLMQLVQQNQSMEAAHKAQEAFRKSTQNMVDELRKSIATMHMSTEDARIYALTLQGTLTPTQEAYIRTLHRREEAEKRIKDAAEEARKAIERQQKQMQQAGVALKQRLMTPLEEYRKAVQEARDLLRGGFIDQTTFRRAMIDAQNNLNKANLTAHVKVELGLNEAVRAGSDELLKMMNDLEMRHRRGMANRTLPVPPLGMPPGGQIPPGQVPPGPGGGRQPSGTKAKWETDIGSIAKDIKELKNIAKSLMGNKVAVFKPANLGTGQTSGRQF